MINDAQYYFWYRENGDHVSGGKTVRDPSVAIFQDASGRERVNVDDNEKPRMVTFRSEYTSQFVTKFGWLLSIDVRGENDCNGKRIGRTG